MRIAIVQVQGSTPDMNIMLAATRAGMQPQIVYVSPENPDDFAGYILTSDFSSDDSFMRVIRAACHAGKPVLGLDQGVQMLVQSGLLPGLENDKPAIKLAPRIQNDMQIRLFDQYQLNAFTRHLRSKTILPVHFSNSHDFVIPPVLLAEMQRLGSTVFYYDDNAVSAISNKVGNVMAMLSHPFQTTEGDPIFHSMRDYIKEGYVQSVFPMNYYPR